MSSSQITIRQATLEDAASVSKLGAKVFLESYRFPHEKKDMNAYLEEHFSKERILKDMEDKNITYFVAEAQGGVVAFVKVNTNMWTPRFKGRLTFEVERLYVQNDFEGQNIGTLLMETVLDLAQKRKYRIIWLSVWENNERAISFHQQFNFEVIGEGVFTLGDTKRKYLVMQKKEAP